MKHIIITFAACMIAFPAIATAENFPLASCSGWDATLVTRTGINTKRATITGVVTQANIEEYCERDPGAETLQYGGKLTLDQCVEGYLRKLKKQVFRATANCVNRTITFYPNRGKPVGVALPLADGRDSSCASGMPPILRQYSLLCPISAKRIGIDN